MKLLGYEIRREGIHRFTIGGIRYEADPCSKGWTPEGAITGEAAIRMIKGRGMTELKVLDMCCGVGIVGITIFTKLKDHVREIVFADINIFNLNSLRRTLKINGLDALVGSQICCVLSDGLNCVPHGEKFDIIVSNPPHYLVKDYVSKEMNPETLGIYDAGWAFHESFYKQCHEYLTERGEVWFLENSDGAKESDLLPFIKANPHLEYVESITEPLDPTFFWMTTRRVSDARDAGLVKQPSALRT